MSPIAAIVQRRAVSWQRRVACGVTNRARESRQLFRSLAPRLRTVPRHERGESRRHGGQNRTDTFLWVGDLFGEA